jgi:CRP-like cAMP-binding protein
MLLSINRKDFMQLIQNKPAFGLSLLKALSERLRFMTSKLK